MGAAALLYRWVERPAQETSSRVRFVREERRDAALAAAAAK
jgi:peptidoglycan/LPS O-acetylase OafA/YrhL